MMNDAAMFQKAQQLRDDFLGCPDPTVSEIKDFMLKRLVAPENRDKTTLKLSQPYSMSGDMVVIDVHAYRGDRSCVIKTVITNDGQLHSFDPEPA